MVHTRNAQKNVGFENLKEKYRLENLVMNRKITLN